MKIAIRRSGYLLEQRVSKVIRDNGYHVDSNASFLDPTTGKSREYDTSAVIAFDLLRRDGKIDFLWFHIVCECENNEQPVVFFLDDASAPDLLHEGVVCSGFPLRSAKGSPPMTISELLHFEDFHHLWRWPIATQYCSFHRKNTNAPWIALHEEAHHGTVVSLLAALECEIDEHYRLLEKRGVPRDTISITIYYPVIVFGGLLYQANESKRGLVLTPRNYLQFRKESWEGQHRRVYHVDVIRESYIHRYLRVLEKELDAIRSRARHDEKDLLLALKGEMGKVRRRHRGTSLRELLDPRAS